MPFQFTVEYKKGKEHVADALSRHAIQHSKAVSVVPNPEWGKRTYRTRARQLPNKAYGYQQQSFNRRKDTLYLHNRVCIPKTMVPDLLPSYHEEPTHTGGHSGVTKTCNTTRTEEEISLGLR